MDDISAVKNDIESGFPDLHVKSIDYIGEGMDSKAFVINDDLIFRFPKNQDVANQLKVEIELLPKLATEVSLPVPNFIYVGTQSNGLPFVGYRKIHGVNLTKELLSTLDDNERQTAFKQIADFLQRMHAFSIEIAKQCGAQASAFKDDFAADLQTLRNEVFNLLSEDKQRYVELLYSDYLSDDTNFVYTPALIHADLGDEHILWNEEEKKISGIIDFGDVNIGDPDYDFMYPYEEWGEANIHEILKYYPHNNHTLLFKKLEFFRRSDTLNLALIGVHRKDDDVLRKALDELEKDILLGA